jgi:hypothetical protein
MSSPTSFLKKPLDRVKLNITVGDVVHGFKCVEKQFIPERNFTAYLFVHPCGAEHLHLECDDMENSFITAFKTLPTNSKVRRFTQSAVISFRTRPTHRILCRESLTFWSTQFCAVASHFLCAIPFSTCKSVVWQRT